jgi:hypothetical protein
MFTLFRRKTPVLPMHHNYKEKVVTQNEFPSMNAVYPWDPAFQDTVIIHNPLFVGTEQLPRPSAAENTLQIVVDAFEREEPK